MTDRVLVTVDAGILTATLNRPDKKNAIDTPMIDALLTMLERADLDAAVRVVAVRGAGSDFCAGMDLHELLASADKSVDENRRAALRFAEIFLSMRRLPKPIVAVVRGRALAGGCGLATACDLVLAAETAQFGYPEVQRGSLAGGAAIACAVALALEEGEPAPKRFCDAVAESASAFSPEFASILASIPKLLKWEPRSALAAIARFGLAPDESPDWPGISPFVVPSVTMGIYAFLREPNDFRAALQAFLKK